jgi:hypothetical protein
MEHLDSAQPAPASTSGAAATSFRPYRHIVVGLAIALIAPFTGFAWPFAILTGIVIGKDEVERRRGVWVSTAATVVRALAVTGGVLAMMVFGAVIAGLIAFLIVALAAFSERAAADAESFDRVVARLLLIVIPAIAYVVLLGLGASVDLRVGA